MSPFEKMALCSSTSAKLPDGHSPQGGSAYKTQKIRGGLLQTLTSTLCVFSFF
jgi:hypothetical protein